jgi:choline dehydrogenase-like flavoprotein
MLLSISSSIIQGSREERAAPGAAGPVLRLQPYRARSLPRTTEHGLDPSRIYDRSHAPAPLSVGSLPFHRGSAAASEHGPAYLSHEADAASFFSTVAPCAQSSRSAGFSSPWLPRRGQADVQDDAVLDYIPLHVQTLVHQIGPAKVGVRRATVVDPDCACAVSPIARDRFVDLSTFLLRTPTSLDCLGEKGADLGLAAARG